MHACARRRNRQKQQLMRGKACCADVKSYGIWFIWALYHMGMDTGVLEDVFAHYAQMNTLAWLDWADEVGQHYISLWPWTRGHSEIREETIITSSQWKDHQ